MRRMTLSTKVIVIMVSMLLFITIITTTVLVKASRSDLQSNHQQLRLGNQEQFKLIKNLLSQRLVVWIEAFSQQSLTNQPNIEHLKNQITFHYDMLRIQWQVEDIWIVDEKGVVSGPDSDTLPASIQQLISRTRSQVRPMFASQCSDTCRQLVSVPVLVDTNKVAIVVVATSMHEMVAMLGESTISKASIVGLTPQSAATNETQLRPISMLTEDARLYMQSVLDAIRVYPISTLILEGALLQIGDMHLSVSLLPLEQANSQGFYVIAVQDVTDSVEQIFVYQRSVFVSATLLFIVFVVLTLYLFTRFRRRLLNLSQRLPLLAKRQFDHFHQQRLDEKSRHLLGFIDELDTLENATEKLAIELASLDEQNRKNLSKLEKMAMYDPLTELPNRNMLNFQIDKLLSMSKRSNILVSLMFIDLDDFKKVNDAFGHDVGDHLLQIAGQRISQTIRDADIATRFGGDEFVILLSDIENKSQIETVANKLIQSFAQPLHLEDKPFYVSISIGISFTKNAELSSVELLKHADIAMYEAKSVSGSAFRVYDATMNKKLIKRVDMEAAARSALLDNQFSLALQPIIDLDSRLLIGFEALLRWQHPEKGLIPPGDFIPVLENTPFMLQLDYWVIARACRILQSMSENGLPNIKICINLSASQFSDPSLPTYLNSQIEKYGVKPSNLELELTETALVADMASAVSIIKRIQALGCKISIDDFGTGYASLSYLKNIPADVVKLDQSFIAGMMDSQSDRNIVYAAISMVKGIGMEVVAEGIELPSQYELLCHFGCHNGQGYFISRPVDEERIWQVIENKLEDGAWQLDLPPFGENENQISLF